MKGMLDRRRFLVGGAGLAAGALLGPFPAAAAKARGPKVILVRFGGGVRRRETIDPATTYSPYLAKTLAPRGTLFRNVEISGDPGIETSHGQGTLNLLIGRYAQYRDIENQFLRERFEPEHPTVFECLRRHFDVAPHEALLVNGEDRIDEEFYTFSNHADYGARYRSHVLSLYRFKRFLLKRKLASGGFDDEAGAESARLALAKLDAHDTRDASYREQGPVINMYWERFLEHYGDSGLRHPRGDALLTELALRALDELRPRFLMINYNDADYVHWGNPTHYHRGIAVMDDGLRRIVERVDHDPFYRGDTVIAVVPDCGRDDNRMMALPYQHHFNSSSSRKIFAFFLGAGVPRGHTIDRRVEQIAIAPTLAAHLGAPFPHAAVKALEEAFV